MKKVFLVLLQVAGITLFLLLPSSYSQQNSILLEAKKLTYLESPSLIIAEGKVEVLFEDIIIKAEKIKINLDTAYVRTSGKVQLNFDSCKVGGKDLTFSLEEREGFIKDLQAKQKEITLQSKKAQLSSEKIDLVEGEFTTCNLPSPHYHIRAKTIEFYPGEKIVIKNATFFVGSIPLFWAPSYTYYLTKKNKFLLPRPGYSEKTGWFIRTSYLFYPLEDTEGTLHLDYYQKKGWAGGLDIFYLSRGSMNIYYIKEKDTQASRGVAKIQYIDYPSTASLLKLNINYLTDEGLFDDYLYYLQEEQRQTFPSSLTLDFRERGVGIQLQVQKKINPTDNYPEFLPRLKLNLSHPSRILEGLYIKQNTELANFSWEGEEGMEIFSSLNFSYPGTIFRYIRFKPTFGGQFFWYKSEGKAPISNTAIKQDFDFSLYLKGNMGGLTHRIFTTFGWHNLQKSGQDSSEPALIEEKIKEENMLRWRMQNRFFWKDSPLFFLTLQTGYDLSSKLKKLKPLEVLLNVPLREGKLYADLSYDFYEDTFSYFRGGVNLEKENWNLDLSYSNYPSNEEFILASTSFDVGKNLSFSGKIEYNLKLKEMEKLSFEIDAKLHCLGLKLDIQEKPSLSYGVSFYITAFPF